MSYPLPLTRTEAYLAYKAGVIQQSELKPSLAVPRIGIDAWLAYWTQLTNDYPKNPDGTPMILQEEEAYIAYLCGVIDTYPEKCLRRVGAYLRYIISARWGRPDHPLNREELYLSLIKTQFIPSGDPSTDIEIDGTAKAAFVDVKMYGNTFQQSYEGKNLYNATPYSIAQQGITTTIKDGYIFECSGTSTNTYSNIANWTNVNLPAGTYTFCIDHTLTQNITMRLSFGSDTQDVVIAPGKTSRTVTVSSPIVTMRPFIATGGSGRVIDETIKINVVAGSTPATVFEPYVGGIASPNPDYPQPIQTVTGAQMVEVAGKNMLNIDGFVAAGGYVGLTVELVDKDDSTGTIGLKLTGNVSANPWSIYAQTNDMQLKPNTTYTLSRTFSESGGLRNAGGIRMKIGSSYTATTTDASVTFTTDSTGIVQVLIYAAYNQVGPTTDIDATVMFSNLLLEEGSSATQFAPYSKHVYSIDLGSIELCKLGTYQDYIWKDGEDWKVHKATAKITLNNTADASSWSKSNSTANNVYINQNIPNLVKGSPIVATNLETYPAADIYSRDIVGICYNTTVAGLASIRIGVGLSGANTINLFKSWLEENPVTAYYALATPTDTIITNQALIDQLEALVNGGAEDGTTYIKVSATDPNLPAKLYVEAPKYD